MLVKVLIKDGYGFINRQCRFLRLVNSPEPVRVKITSAISEGELISTAMRAPMALELPEAAKKVEFYADADMTIEVWASMLPLEYSQLTMIGAAACTTRHTPLQYGKNRILAANMRQAMRLLSRANVYVGGSLAVSNKNGWPVMRNEPVDLPISGEMFAYLPPPRITTFADAGYRLSAMEHDKGSVISVSGVVLYSHFDGVSAVGDTEWPESSIYYKLPDGRSAPAKGAFFEHGGKNYFVRQGDELGGDDGGLPLRLYEVVSYEAGAFDVTELVSVPLPDEMTNVQAGLHRICAADGVVAIDSTLSIIAIDLLTLTARIDKKTELGLGFEMFDECWPLNGGYALVRADFNALKIVAAGEQVKEVAGVRTVAVVDGKVYMVAQSPHDLNKDTVYRFEPQTLEKQLLPGAFIEIERIQSVKAIAGTYGVVIVTGAGQCIAVDSSDDDISALVSSSMDVFGDVVTGVIDNNKLHVLVRDNRAPPNRGQIADFDLTLERVTPESDRIIFIAEFLV